MTTDRAEALMRFGYNARQASFLALVAAHGGYFIRRQFLAYLGRGHGAVTVEFLRAVLSRGHAIGARLRSHAQVYHVTAKPLYVAIGEPDSRHRRRHELSTIRRRLMGLDFVLAHRDWTFFATERDTLDFFTHDHQLPRALLPATQYTGQDETSTQTTRYFTERFPIGVTADRSLVVLAYVDDAEVTEAGFERFLRGYAPLCRRLSSHVQLTFVTAVDGQAPLAERAFTRILGRLDGGECGLHDATESELFAYVRARDACEHGALAGLRQEELDAMRERLQRFQQATAEDLYRAWQTSGDDAVRAFISRRQPVTHVARMRLAVHRLPFDYRPFGAWKAEGC
jgi:hypothetical protein